MANGKKTDRQRISAAERRIKVLELRKAGTSYRAIGELLGVSQETAHRDVQHALKALAALELESAAEYRTLELERLDVLTVVSSRILAASHPLVSGGRVLSGFTEDGRAIGLTDDGPRLQAIDRLLRISESRRKLLGLDAAPKVPLNPDGTPYAAYAELRTTILELLAPYPEIRLMLAEALDPSEGVDDSAAD